MEEEGLNGSAQPPASRLAVASFWLALIGGYVLLAFGCGCHPRPLADFLPAVGAFVLGILAMIHIRRGRRAVGGMGLAIAGVVMSAAFAYWGIWDDLACERRAERPITAACLSNLKQLAVAVRLYGDDHDGQLPSPDVWNNATTPYVKNRRVYTCPRADDRQKPSYAMNARLKGLRGGDVAAPDQTVLLFESVPGESLSGGPELFPSPARHRSGHNVCFVSGRVSTIPEADVGKLNWDPGRPGPADRGPPG